MLSAPDLHPLPRLAAPQHRLPDPHLRVPVLERREVGLVRARLLPARDVAVEVAEQVARAVRVALGVAARVVRVAARVRVEERAVLDEALVRAVAVADPE